MQQWPVLNHPLRSGISKTESRGKEFESESKSAAPWIWTSPHPKSSNNSGAVWLLHQTRTRSCGHYGSPHQHRFCRRQTISNCAINFILNITDCMKDCTVGLHKHPKPIISKVRYFSGWRYPGEDTSLLLLLTCLIFFLFSPRLSQNC